MRYVLAVEFHGTVAVPTAEFGYSISYGIRNGPYHPFPSLLAVPEKQLLDFTLINLFHMLSSNVGTNLGTEPVPACSKRAHPFPKIPLTLSFHVRARLKRVLLYQLSYAPQPTRSIQFTRKCRSRC